MDIHTKRDTTRINLLKVIKKIVNKHEKIIDNFISEAPDKINTEMSIVLMHHLFIESLIDKIFENTFPSTSYFKKKSFSEKVKLLEAIGLDNEDQELREILSVINKLRNEFAHNTNFKLSSKKCSQYFNNLTIGGDKVSGVNNLNKFTNTVLYLMGNLRVMLSLNTIFPVVSFYSRSNHKDRFLTSRGLDKIINKELDKFFKDDEILKIVTGEEKV